MTTLHVGRIYRFKTRQGGYLTRIFRSGGAGCYSGRGCTKETATPENHIRATDVQNATTDEINTFLEKEMENGMVKTANIPLIRSLGEWVHEEQSGYLGFRCQNCSHWIYAGKEMRCACDGTTEGLI